MSETSEVLALAERLARAAGAIQRERYETDVRIGTKSAAIDLVTEVDHACEALMVETLRAERPDDAVLAEEGRGQDRADAAWRWIIDPLDGTTNYAHGYPRFCVSIGVEQRGVRSVGVVYDPLLEELYTAVRGQGSFLNGRRLQVSEETELGRSLVATGFAYDVRQNPADNLDHFAAFVKNARAVRRDGSAALDLCYLAAGRFDGFWELQLHPWDVAAGFLIVEEAGGRVSDRAGGPPPRSGRDTVASNGRIHAAMLKLLAG
jgi:myo-inositol-1(or 4)-monophosphatase